MKDTRVITLKERQTTPAENYFFPKKLSGILPISFTPWRHVCLPEVRLFTLLIRILHIRFNKRAPSLHAWAEDNITRLHNIIAQ